MFAIALWDREKNILTLARDRIGEKPLYYGWQGTGDNSVFLFCSELKALRAHPSFEKKINRNALCLQLRHNHIPAPHSIYQGIWKLLPGTSLTISLKNKEAEPLPYWSAASTILNSIKNPFLGSIEDAANHLENLLKNIISKQLVADVPLGAFLSGGVDSSTIVSLMQHQSSKPIKTFTIGFSEDFYNEAQYARLVANHIRTDHTELYVTPKNAIDIIPYLPYLYDEPFSDPSQIPTFLVSKLAKTKVKVALSGDGGDELFCGYSRYRMTSALWKLLSILPFPARNITSKTIGAIPPELFNALGQSLNFLFPSSLKTSKLGDKINKAGNLINSKTLDDLYFSMLSHWDDPASVVINSIEPQKRTVEALSSSNLGSLESFMAHDLLNYLPNDILVKVDRATMAVGLEARVPFLDHRLIEFAWSLPHSFKVNRNETKLVLRKVLERYVPADLVTRPKMGFGVPIAEWLRGPLRSWAETLLDEQRLRTEGFFHPEPILLKWNEHLSGKRNWANQLWAILMFQSWLETQ